MTLRVSASFRKVASSGREKGRERGLAPVHLSFYLKALHPAVETQLIWIPLPLNSLASANIFQREIKFPFRLKCKIEFGLSPKKAKLQAKLVKSFAHFKILEKQSLVPSQAPCPVLPPLSHQHRPLPLFNTTAGLWPLEADAPVRVVDLWYKVTWCVNLGLRIQGLWHFYNLTSSLCMDMKQLEGWTSGFTFFIRYHSSHLTKPSILPGFWSLAEWAERWLSAGDLAFSVL